jgi:hypothetical protein
VFRVLPFKDVSVKCLSAWERDNIEIICVYVGMILKCRSRLLLTTLTELQIVVECILEGAADVSWIR